jgi:pimeloyl-ACP methyl ester carboxylesterase
MPYARASDGVRLYFETHGPSGTRSAPPKGARGSRSSAGVPLILAYGIGGNTDMWAPNTPALAAARRLILWEPRGHARSDSPADPARYSFRRWALDLRDVLDHLGVRRAHVGGLSLGASIATRFALLYPRRVRSLVVTNSSSASGLPLSVENLVMRARSIEVTLTRCMDAMAEYAMAANPNVAGRLALDPGARAEFYEEYRRLTPVGYANSLRTLLAMDHITDELPRLAAHGIPVLLVGGDRDPSLGPMRVMRRKIRGSRLVVLAPASHFANRDQPAAWNRPVLAFLRRVEAGRGAPRPSPRARAGYSRIQLSASGISGAGGGPPLGWRRRRASRSRRR